MDIFGRYIHTYKFNEAVADGVVKDLMYEGRVHRTEFVISS